MDPSALTELAESIKAQGVIQPIVVRAQRQGQLRDHRRRTPLARRAAAGLSDVPVVLREVDDRAVIAMALIENIQREDLNPLEEAQALQRLIDEFGLTHQQAAEAVGRSRAAVSNLLRLLELPPEAASCWKPQDRNGPRPRLLTLPTHLQVRLAVLAAENGWSVRELEAEARKAQAQPKPKAAPRRDANVTAWKPSCPNVSRRAWRSSRAAAVAASW